MIRRLILWTLLPAVVLLAAFMVGALVESAIFDALRKGQCISNPYLD